MRSRWVTSRAGSAAMPPPSLASCATISTRWRASSRAAITSARRALRAEQMQRELLAASRMAGMAEVATGVLHNVGNVLNSLNVSVSQVEDQLRTSKVSALARSVDAFAAHPGGLAGFLATDKGRRVPEYLATLARHLEDENARERVELAEVVRNVEHIKTIVATQQSYAVATDQREPVDVGALVDDALRIGAASFVENGVEVVRDYEDLPMILTDRHRLLQSVVNLIGNARHALFEAPAAERRLTAHVRRVPAGLAIAVADNGVGIAADHLPRIFEHGFTTKKNGHGFGLHASANALREIGGTLSVFSAGLGRGATFTIELPLDVPDRIYAAAS
jgi:signal transduction histidine kinase